MDPRDVIARAREVTASARGEVRPKTRDLAANPPGLTTALLRCEDTGKVRVVLCGDPWAAADRMKDVVGGEVTVVSTTEDSVAHVLESMKEASLGGNWLKPGSVYSPDS